MKKKWLRLSLLVLLGCAAGASRASAVSLSLVSADTIVSVGDAVDVDVMIAGLGNFAPLTLRGFDLDIAFDASVLSFDGAAFGADLGGPGSSISFFSASGGVVDLAESSLLSVAALDALQPGSFRLATLSFTAIAEGTSPLGFTQTLLDRNGGTAGERSIPVDAALGLSVMVSAAPVGPAVPEPTGLLLFGVGIVVVGAALGDARRPGAKPTPR